jgi:hypothetical protein
MSKWFLGNGLTLNTDKKNIFNCFYLNQLMHKYISPTISLYNVHSYMFWHLCVILRDQHNNNNRTATRDCICSHKNTLLAQDIITSHRIYCITQQQPNNILIYFNLIIIRNCNFNSLNFKNLLNLAWHKFFKMHEDDTVMSKLIGVNII